MAQMSSTLAIESFPDFGAFLRYLRRRVSLTQRDLAIAVGYSEAQISRLEHNQRLPDLTTLAALFIPALDLHDEPELVARMMELAAAARGESLVGRSLSATRVVVQEMPDLPDILEPIPALPPYLVQRDAVLARLRRQLAEERRVALCGLAGAGKTTLAAALAHERLQSEPVCWITLTPGIITSVESLIRRLALFLLQQGHERMRLLLEPATHNGATPALDQQLTMLCAVFARQPALLCFDNLHLVQRDAAVLQLLTHLAAVAPAELLLISREVVPLPNFPSMRLEGMEQAEALVLVARLVDGLERGIAERLVQRTQGIPMLIRLAAGALRDRGTARASFIDHLDQESQVAAYLVDAMLTRLSPAARMLLDFMAVFRHPLNLHDELIIELSRAVLGTSNPAAVLAEIRAQYLFDDLAQARLHPLLHEYLYTALLADAPRRRRLHRLAAEWSTRGADDSIEAVYHLGRAGKLQQAVDRLAGQTERLVNQGQAVAAADIAADLIVQLRRHGDQSPLLRRILAARGDLLSHTVRTLEAEADYREALALTQQPALRAQLAYRLAQSLVQRGEAAEALEWCRAVSGALQPSDTVLLALLAAVECTAYLRLRQHSEAEQIAARALALADQAALVLPAAADEVRAQAHNTLAIAASLAGQVTAALEHWQAAIAAARRAGMRRLEYRSRFNLGNVLFEQGNFPAALRHYREALAGLREIGDSYVTARALNSIGQIEYLRGELSAALSTHEQAAQLKEQMGDRHGLANSLAQQARTLLALGRYAEGRLLIERALDETADSADLLVRGYYLLIDAEVLLLEGRYAAAQDLLQQAQALPGISQNPRFRCDLQHHMAVAQLSAGDLEGARQLLEPECPPEAGVELLLERQLLRALLALAAGDPSSAQHEASATAEQARQAGYRRHEQIALTMQHQAHTPPPPALYPRLLWGPLESPGG